MGKEERRENSPSGIPELQITISDTHFRGSSWSVLPGYGPSIFPSLYIGLVLKIKAKKKEILMVLPDGERHL